MAFPTEGTLTTDKREIAISETLDSTTDWEQYQSKQSIVIQNGVISLEEIQFSLVDRFEDADLAEYTINTGSWDVVTDTFSDGDFALEGFSDGDNEGIASTSGLDNYFSPGNTARCDFKITGSQDAPSVLFGVPDETFPNGGVPNGYQLRLLNGNETLGIRVDGGNNGQNKTSLPSALAFDTKYIFEMDYRDTTSDVIGRILEADETQLAEVSITDSSRSGSGIGFDVNTEGSSGTMLFDFFRVLTA